MRRIFELDGWLVAVEDSYNWLMQKDGFDPILIPHRVKTLPFAVHDHCLVKSNIVGDRYHELKNEAMKQSTPT